MNLNLTSKDENNIWDLKKKNTLEGVNSRLDITEEKISELENIAIETI